MHNVKRFFKKHTFLFKTCIVILILSLFCGVFTVMGWGDLLHQTGAAVIYPFQWLFSWVGDSVSGFGDYLKDMDTLISENQALKAENESLKSQINDAEILADEHTWLYAYLQMKQEHEDYAMCAAIVIATNTTGESGSYVLTCTLNKGTAHGIERGMPVVTTRGLVGMVTEVGLNQCTVTTILDTSISVSSIDTKTLETGLTEGDFSCLFDGKTRLKYLSENSNVAIGNTIVTGGLGSVYPYGIPIGKISDIQIDPLSRTTMAVITPFCDFQNLNSVVVLTNYVRYAEGSHIPQYGEGSS